MPHLAWHNDAIGEFGLGYCANSAHQEERPSTARMRKSNPGQIYTMPQPWRRGKATERGVANPDAKYGGRESAWIFRVNLFNASQGLMTEHFSLLEP